MLFSSQPTPSRPVFTPSAKAHQPHVFVPGSAQRSDHGQYLHQLQDQARSDHRKVTPENYLAQHKKHQMQEMQRVLPEQLILDRHSYSDTTRPEHQKQQQQQPQTHRRPSISPEQRALLTGIPAKQTHSVRQPLISMNGNAGHNYIERTPVTQSKSHTELRALNDSGFGMKAPLQQQKMPGDHAQRQMHPLSVENRPPERRAQATSSRLSAGNNGNYGDRLMALQGRIAQGGRTQANGEKTLRSESYLWRSLESD